MIKQILELLSLNEYLGQSELIDIAKGKNELTTDLKGKRRQRKQIEAHEENSRNRR